MIRQFTKALFIFRRDLRLEDNTALIAALESSAEVMPCFIFDPRQIDEQPYRAEASVSFMIASLHDLRAQLEKRGARLFVFYGQAHDIVDALVKQEQVDAVFVNADYTPFSRARDLKIEQVCKQHHVVFNAMHDALLNPPDAVAKDDGTFYTVFTPYARKAMMIKVAFPTANTLKNYYTKKSALENSTKFSEIEALSPERALYPGGRTEALRILAGIKDLKGYDEERNVPFLQGTTKLSPHHKFGTCSVRETYQAVYKAFGISHTLIRELYWRDFFTQIGYHYPHVLGKSFYPKYDQLAWDDNETFFTAWRSGKTGFPIVDAGMRELNQTGFMHNRVRMIAASFLIKDLHIDWRRGEQYFARHLVDYDPLVNNGNWQWAASTGCDAAPYFRIFNPWLQQAKFDPDARYIKQWVPALRGAAPKDIHAIATKGHVFADYPAPIVWHEHEKSKALSAYGKV